MGVVVEQLKAEGYEMTEHDLAHISPARFEPSNPYGQYNLNVEEELGSMALRPLRQSPPAQP